MRAINSQKNKQRIDIEIERRREIYKRIKTQRQETGDVYVEVGCMIDAIEDAAPVPSAMSA